MADDKNIQHHVHVLAFEWNAGNVAFSLTNLFQLIIYEFQKYEIK